MASNIYTRIKYFKSFPYFSNIDSKSETLADGLRRPMNKDIKFRESCPKFISLKLKGVYFVIIDNVINPASRIAGSKLVFKNLKVLCKK